MPPLLMFLGLFEHPMDAAFVSLAIPGGRYFQRLPLTDFFSSDSVVLRLKP